MSDEIKISILMPAKNASQFINACIDSVIAQNFKAWELLVVDDFSDDKTFEILSQYSFSDKRIKVFKNNSVGIIPALSLAFQHSKGNYITRMDADDIMPTNKLDLFLTEIRRSSLKTVITGKVNYFSNESVSNGYTRYQNWLNNLGSLKNRYAQIYRECIVASPNWIAHRSCFENEINIEDLIYPEDYDMVFKWYKTGYQIKQINETTHLWREHENRTSRTNIDYQQKAFFTLKTNYFIDIELQVDEKIQLIGAGIKGKLVAKILNERNVKFDWFDFNSQQESIDGILNFIQPISYITKNHKSILTVWPESEITQQEITDYLTGIGLEFGKNVWLF